MRGAILALALFLPAAACSPSQDQEAAAITAVMRGLFDKPGLPLDAGPVAVSGGHAVADWTQGAMGGRALLERRGGKWVIRLCSGESLRDATVLRAAGVPAANAEAIAAGLAEAERSVSAERLKRMASFKGTVEM